jgi:hypothetical protein
MLSERNSRAELYNDIQYDEEIENEKSNPWDLENLLPDEQVNFIFWGCSKSNIQKRKQKDDISNTIN